jgi:hypothetical protein
MPSSLELLEYLLYYLIRLRSLSISGDVSGFMHISRLQVSTVCEEGVEKSFEYIHPFFEKTNNLKFKSCGRELTILETAREVRTHSEMKVEFEFKSDWYHTTTFPEGDNIILKPDVPSVPFPSDFQSGWIFDFQTKKLCLSVLLEDILPGEDLNSDLYGISNDVNAGSSDVLTYTLLCGRELGVSEDSDTKNGCGCMSRY